MESENLIAGAGDAGETQSLPRLLYIGDVPVEASYHGSALLYRLLEDYPKERLKIVEAGVQLSRPERRLAGVSYEDRRLLLQRLDTTRFAPLYEKICVRTAAPRARAMRRLVSDFRPEAILTVTHGYPWITAARLARDFGLPLHLICHDEWSLGKAPSARAWRGRVFGEVYRQARSRMCVSPQMTKDYEGRYGACSEVITRSLGVASCLFGASVVPAEERLDHRGRFRRVVAEQRGKPGGSGQSPSWGSDPPRRKARYLRTLRSGRRRCSRVRSIQCSSQRPRQRPGYSGITETRCRLLGVADNLFNSQQTDRFELVSLKNDRLHGSGVADTCRLLPPFLR